MAIDYPRDHTNDVDVHIARTTFQNRNFLAPINGQADIVEYDVVLKLLENGQVVSCLMTTPTDLEVLAIDTNGERSDYTQQCHGMLARHLNAALNRGDSIWSHGGPDEAVLCDDPAEAIDHIAKLIARPVEQGWVEDVRHWKGAKILPDMWGEEQIVVPKLLSERATHTDAIKYTPMPPAVLQKHYTVDVARNLVNEAIVARVEMLNSTRLARTGSSKVVGRRRCNNLDPFSTSDQPRRAMLPHFVGGKSRVEEAMHDLRNKRAFYYECRDLFRGSAKDVVFAAGTVMMRKLGAYCDPLPSTQIIIPPWEFVPPPKPAT